MRIVSRTLLILTGWPGAGKTRTASMIREWHPSLRLLSYDRLKEAWYEAQGFDSPAARRKLDEKSLAAFWRLLGREMETGADILIEYPFCEKHVPALSALLERHGYRGVTVVLEGEPKVLWQRYMGRDRRSNRHVSYVCDVYHKDGLKIRGRHPSLEEYRQEGLQKNYHINLGETYVMDMTDLGGLDFSGLKAFLAEHLEA